MTSANYEDACTSPRLFHVVPLDKTVVDYQRTQPYILSPDAPCERVLAVGPFQIDSDLFLELAKPHTLTRKMTEDEFKALRISIDQHGNMDEVYLDMTGRIVDGYHRICAMCMSLKSSANHRIVPYKVVDFDSEAAEYEFVLLKNATRRHLSISDRKQMLIQLLHSGHNGTDGLMASMVGLSLNTAKKERQDLEDAGTLAVLPYRRAANGKMYKAGRATSSRAPSNKLAKASETDSQTGAIEVQSDIDSHHNEKTFSTQLHQGKDISPHYNQPPSICNAEPSEVGGKKLKSDQLADSHSTMQDEAYKESANTDELLNTWWQVYGLEPVSSSDLIRALSGGKTSADKVKKKDNVALGKRLKNLAGSTCAGYFVQVREVSGARLYYLRPAEWSKHGPRTS